MTGMGVILNDDAMEDALKFVRKQPRLLDDQQIAASGATAAPKAATPPARKRAATTAPTEAHPDTVSWLHLERERRQLETRLKALVSDQEKLRLKILERWSMDGTSQEKPDGFTVHMKRKVYPKVTDPAAFVEAAIKEGRTFLLTVDTKTLAVWATTKEEEGEPLPPSLAAHLGEQFERFDLAVRLRGGDQ